jgi:hypothetical protein
LGFARIISGGPTGRYTVELDYGDAMRTAALTAINQQLLKIDAQLLLTQAELIQAEAREAAKRAEIQGYADALIAAADQPRPTGLGLGTLPIVKAQRQLAEILAANQPIRDQLAALKFERANWRRKLTALTNLPTKVQRQAWCVDFTEDIPALAYSATCDIPGDPNLVLLAPGGRAWQASDGEFRARELLSPAQAFVNTAVYPGWQKWRPTYRWGTITAVDYDANRVSVALFDQKSDAQRLPVNQAATLSNVVVAYMDCDSAIFNVSDRVVVEFQGQNWASPRVIGFLDNPRPCNWPLVGFASATLSNYVFRSKVASALSAVLNPAASAQIKFDGGAWTTMTDGGIVGASPDSGRIFTHVYDNGSPTGGDAFIVVNEGAITDFPFSTVTCYAASLFPSWPLPQTSTIQYVVEFRIQISGSTIFNVAILSTMGVDGKPRSAATKGGIQTSLATKLNYTLTG